MLLFPDKMISEDEKLSILNSYKWIKVPKYIDDDMLTWEERYLKLHEHHIQETTFLIEKIRAIVKDDSSNL